MSAVHKTTITKHTAIREFKLWNHILFNDELETVPRFLIKKDLDKGYTEGYFCEDEDSDDTCTIKINRTIASENHKQFSIILIHEMVHMLQWQRGLDVEHDDFFYKTCAEIKKKIKLDVQ